MPYSQETQRELDRINEEFRERINPERISGMDLQAQLEEVRDARIERRQDLLEAKATAINDGELNEQELQDHANELEDRRQELTFSNTMIDAAIQGAQRGGQDTTALEAMRAENNAELQAMRDHVDSLDLPPAQREAERNQNRGQNQENDGNNRAPANNNAADEGPGDHISQRLLNSQGSQELQSETQMLIAVLQALLNGQNGAEAYVRSAQEQAGFNVPNNGVGTQQDGPSAQDFDRGLLNGSLESIVDANSDGLSQDQLSFLQRDGGAIDTALGELNDEIAGLEQARDNLQALGMAVPDSITNQLEAATALRDNLTELQTADLERAGELMEELPDLIEAHNNGLDGNQQQQQQQQRDDRTLAERRFDQAVDDLGEAAERDWMAMNAPGKTWSELTEDQRAQMESAVADRVAERLADEGITADRVSYDENGYLQVDREGLDQGTIGLAAGEMTDEASDLNTHATAVEELNAVAEVEAAITGQSPDEFRNQVLTNAGNVRGEDGNYGFAAINGAEGNANAIQAALQTGERQMVVETYRNLQASVQEQVALEQHGVDLRDMNAADRAEAIAGMGDDFNAEVTSRTQASIAAATQNLPGDTQTERHAAAIAAIEGERVAVDAQTAAIDNLRQAAQTNYLTQHPEVDGANLTDEQRAAMNTYVQAEVDATVAAARADGASTLQATAAIQASTSALTTDTQVREVTNQEIRNNLEQRGQTDVDAQNAVIAQNARDGALVDNPGTTQDQRDLGTALAANTAAITGTAARLEASGVDPQIAALAQGDINNQVNGDPVAPTPLTLDGDQVRDPAALNANTQAIEDRSRAVAENLQAARENLQARGFEPEAIQAKLEEQRDRLADMDDNQILQNAAHIAENTAAIEQNNRALDSFNQVSQQGNVTRATEQNRQPEDLNLADNAALNNSTASIEAESAEINEDKQRLETTIANFDQLQSAAREGSDGQFRPSDMTDRSQFIQAAANGMIGQNGVDIDVSIDTMNRNLSEELNEQRGFVHHNDLENNTVTGQGTINDIRREIVRDNEVATNQGQGREEDADVQHAQMEVNANRPILSNAVNNAVTDTFANMPEEIRNALQQSGVIQNLQRAVVDRSHPVAVVSTTGMDHTQMAGGGTGLDENAQDPNLQQQSGSRDLA